ncbi:ribosomal RNA-processing protein 7 homolog A [Onthophagus taurus]|uniref:ribosomal RNA-processing protein 7 homolog A n=1 Tax=Onthophagus taurus TaxID=166361 RepID=UPI000C2054FE|nr:ribosomal RNA-processing protein 7 homolog A [Onthophagus taurus]
MENYKIITCKYSTDSVASHDLFVKEHKVRNHTPEKPAGKTLFILNVPPYATPQSFKEAFSTIGKVTSVQFYDSHENLSQQSEKLGFKVAFVVFENWADLTKALSLKQLPPLTNKNELGLLSWIQEYNSSIVNRKKLEEKCKMIISKYDKEQLKSGKNKQVVDDEGWTVVTGKGKKAGVARTESGQNKLSEKLKRKGVKDFYTFQIKEKKMEKIVELRKKMEENKKRLEAIRSQRKFKPFS